MTRAATARKGFSFLSGTTVKILLVVLVLAVFFGFLDWGLGTATSLMDYVGWGNPGEIKVHSVNVDASATPKFEVTFEYINGKDKQRNIWVEVDGNTPAGAQELGRVPPESDGPMPVGPEDSTGEMTFDYDGDLRNLGCGFTLDVRYDCVGFVAPMIGCTGLGKEISESQRAKAESFSLEQANVPQEWQGQCY